MKKTLLAAIIAATALVPPAALAQDRGNRGGRDRSPSASNAQQAPAGRPSYQSWQSRRSGGETTTRDTSTRPQRQSNGEQRQSNRSWRERAPQAQAQQALPQQQAVPQQQQQQQQQRATRQQWNGNRGQANGNGGQWNRGDRRPDGQVQQQRRAQQSQQFDRGNRNWNGDRNRGNFNDRARGNWNGNSRYNNGNDRGRWNNGWRNDRRYDWRGYRSTNRSLYRLPRYYAPSGWGYGYRRFSIGYTLSSMLYSSQYWINDPFHYRLPEVDGPYRWVRYYNDAILVDIYSGEVVDTIYDIFW